MVATLEELDAEALIAILTQPKNALVKQYEKLFEFEDVNLSFTDGALAAVARKALEQKSGARGLRAILERAMLSLMYELPSRDDVEECVVGEEVIEQGRNPSSGSSAKRSRPDARPRNHRQRRALAAWKDARRSES